MTTVAEFPAAGPRMHAFVIGVGNYPHCADTARGAGSAALARRFGPLSSPPRSALAVAEWLVRNQATDLVAPLGSVELLASGEPPPTFRGPSGPVKVAAPTYANVVAAFERWYARCDADERNIAMFFFSGHGFSRAAGQCLLLEDVGASDLRFFENAIRFDRTYLGMARCRARTQLYLVDACREIPHEVRDMVELDARALIAPRIEQPKRDAPIVNAAAPGERAEGHEGGVTVFTEALLAALDGLAARPDPLPGRWAVTTESLGSTVRRLLERDAAPGTYRQQTTTEGGSSWTTPLRVLPDAPQVLFRLECVPGAALPAAEMRIVRPGRVEPELRRAPTPATWEGSVRAASYWVHALFRAGGYRDASHELWFLPPFLDYALPVELA